MPIRMTRSVAASCCSALVFGACAEDEPQTSQALLAAGSQPIKVLQYNVQGAVRDMSSHTGDSGAADDDDYRFIDVLAERIIAEKPHIVALQEICESQLDRLAQALLGTDSVSVAAKSLNHHRDCPLGEQGQQDGLGAALLIAGAVEPLSAGGVKLLCANWQAFGGVRVCTAHVDPLPARDIPELAEVVNDWSFDAPVIVAGDFNAEPEQDSMSLLYATDVPGGRSPAMGRFYEADMFEAGAEGSRIARRGDNTWCGACPDAMIGVYTRKLDYVLADSAHFQQRMSAVIEDTERSCGTTRCSDHVMYWGEVTLRDSIPGSDPPALGGGFDVLSGEWWGLGTVFPDGFPRLLVDSDGTAKQCRGTDCWNGSLEDLGAGRYAVTLISEVPLVEPWRWTLQAIDCAQDDPICMHRSGPVELDIRSEWHADRYGRPHCTPDHALFGFCTLDGEPPG